MMMQTLPRAALATSTQLRSASAGQVARRRSILQSALRRKVPPRDNASRTHAGRRRWRWYPVAGAKNMTHHPSPQETEWPTCAIFTVGHSTLPIERFITLLQTYGIERLVDVRTVPRSRHNPQFNADELGRTLAQQNIDYMPLQALGGLRHPARIQPIPAGATKASAATPIICKPKGFRKDLEN
jgi:hypothetical protein